MPGSTRPHSKAVSSGTSQAIPTTRTATALRGWRTRLLGHSDRHVGHGRDNHVGCHRQVRGSLGQRRGPLVRKLPYDRLNDWLGSERTHVKSDLYLLQYDGRKRRRTTWSDAHSHAWPGQRERAIWRVQPHDQRNSKHSNDTGNASRSSDDYMERAGVCLVRHNVRQELRKPCLLLECLATDLLVLIADVESVFGSPPSVPPPAPTPSTH